MYDENLGIPEEWISPNTFFSDLWESFNCPFCMSSNEYFHGLENEIMYFEDCEDLSSHEIAHYPFYEVIDWVIHINFDEGDREEDELLKVVLLDEYGDTLYSEDLDWKLDVSFDVSDLSSLEIHVECSWHWIYSTWIIEVE